MTFHTGTCSWAEKSLVESSEFYPPDVKSSEGRLRYYASYFDTVEIDSTYYAIPRPQNAALWAARTPDRFIFHAKAYGALTGHAITPKTLPQELLAELPEKDRDGEHIYVKEPAVLALIGKEFVKALAPLRDSGKLGVVVFQFPPWFDYSVRNTDIILDRARSVGDLAVAVEFRHGSWLAPDRRESVFKLLRDNKLTYVAADEPQYGTLKTVPLVPAVTTDTAYFRLHGRNRHAWRKKGATAAERFAYQYSDNELDEVKLSVMGAAREAKTVFVMFNNHGSPGIRNAAKMGEMLKP